jgi:hypothetical protein
MLTVIGPSSAMNSAIWANANGMISLRPIGLVGGGISTSYSGSTCSWPVIPDVMIEAGSSELLGVAALITSPRWWWCWWSSIQARSLSVCGEMLVMGGSSDSEGRLH